MHNLPKHGKTFHIFYAKKKTIEAKYKLKLYFADHLKKTNTLISSNIGKSTKNSKWIYIFLYVTTYFHVFIQQSSSNFTVFPSRRFFNLKSASQKLRESRPRLLRKYSPLVFYFFRALIMTILTSIFDFY